MSSNAPPHTTHNTPLHLSAADFDAYLPEHAASNAFARARHELKQRMVAWARGVVERLAEMGIAIEATGSDEHPSARNARRADCQRVFFLRDAEARAELERLTDRKRSIAARLGEPTLHKSHAYLAIRLDHERVEVSLEVHAEAWVDVRNMRARLADPERAIELAAALEALPEQFSIGLASDASRAPCSPSGASAGAANDTVRALLDRADVEKSALWIGWSVPRDVVLAHADLLDEQLGDAIVALGPLYKLVAWAPDNDLAVIDRERDEARAERARVHEEAEHDRAEWEARREGERRTAKERPRAKRRHDAPPPPPSEERESDRTLPQPRVEPKVRIPLGARPSAHGPGAFRAGRRASRITAVDPNAPIEKGARVQVLDGPFEGKTGVVQELDGKGGARVMLGLLAVRIAVKDLIVSTEGRDRPVLSSSHRRPIPARS